MATLKPVTIKAKGDWQNGIRIFLESEINFGEADRKLDLIYAAKILVYDVDYNQDILIPTIQRMFHRSNDIDQVRDRNDGLDDVIKFKNLSAFRARTTPKKIVYDFELSSSSHKPNGLLVSDQVFKAMRDEIDGGGMPNRPTKLELKAVLVVTNELNGVVVSESGILRINVVSEVSL